MKLTLTYYCLLLACYLLLSSVQTLNAQNYADSTRNLINQVDTASLSPYQNELIATARQEIADVQSDSALMWKIYILVAGASLDSFAIPFNQLLGRMCVWGLATKTDPKSQQRFSKFYAMVFDMKADWVEQKGNMQESLNLRYKALEMSRAALDTAYTITILQNLGLSHFNTADYKTAERWLEEAVELAEKTGRKNIFGYFRWCTASGSF